MEGLILTFNNVTTNICHAVLREDVWVTVNVFCQTLVSKCNNVDFKESISQFSQ